MAFDSVVNLLETTLGAARTSGATTFTVKTGDGARFGTFASLLFAATPMANVAATGRFIDLAQVGYYRATGRTGDDLTGCTLIDGTDRDYATGDLLGVYVLKQHITQLQDDLNSFTAAGRALLDDADAAAQRQTLELGSAAQAASSDFAAAVHNHDAGAIISGTLAAARMPGLTGAVTSPAGSTATTLANGVVTDANVNAANKDGVAGMPSLRTLGTGAFQAVSGTDSRLSDARPPTLHASSHKDGGSDEVATATPAAGAIPKAGPSGTLAAGWLPPTGLDAGRVVITTTGGVLATDVNLTWDGTVLGLPVVIQMGQGDHGVSGTNTVAIGTAAKALGYGCVALGSYSAANSDYSFVIGFNASATQLGSFAQGINSVANGQGAMALGYISSAGNHYAIAIGFNAQADLLASMAIGGSSHSSHTYSIVFGYNAVTTEDHQIMLGTASEYTMAPGGLVVGSAALATTATRGFLWVPTCAGTPTGVPAAYTGTAPLVIDSSATPPRVCLYIGGSWYYVALTAI